VGFGGFLVSSFALRVLGGRKLGCCRVASLGSGVWEPCGFSEPGSYRLLVLRFGGLRVRVLQGCKFEVWRMGSFAVFPGQVATACLVGGWDRAGAIPAAGVVGGLWTSSARALPELPQDSPKAPQNPRRDLAEVSQSSRRVFPGLAQGWRRVLAGLPGSSPRTSTESSGLWGEGSPWYFRTDLRRSKKTS